MKNLKIVLYSLLISVGAIAASSYVLKGHNINAFAVVCYEYNKTITVHNELNPGKLTTFVEVAPFKLDANWTPKPGDPTIYCTSGLVICKICYDSSVLGGVVTKGRIAEELRLAIIAQNTTPYNGQTFNVTVGGVTISVSVYTHP